MIVKIAAVPPSGRIQVTTTTSSGGATAKDGGPTSGARKPICICNAEQCRMDAIKKQANLAAMLEKNTSLDQLLHVDTGDQDPKPVPKVATAGEKGYILEKSYHQINGDIFEITRKVPVAESKDADGKGLGLLTRKKSLPKQMSQPHLPLRRMDETRISVERPQPPPRVSSRSVKHSDATTPTKSNVQPPQSSQQIRQTQGADSFDRTQRQRHSSRSVGASTSRDMEHDACDEWCQHKDTTAHQRHSSGPSDLSQHQADISEWLLKLPHKRTSAIDVKQLLSRKPSSQTEPTASSSTIKPATDIQLTKSLKDELVNILKRPLQRQHSGPSELSLLRNDIFDWLRSQSISNKILPAPINPKDEPTPAVRTPSGFAAAMTVKSSEPSVAPIPKPRKRHSLGHTSNAQDEEIPDWIPYPLALLSAAGREKLGVAQSSCVDINKKIRSSDRPSTHGERRLRHSASEVVTPVTTITDKSFKTDRSNALKTPLSSSKTTTATRGNHFRCKHSAPVVTESMVATPTHRSKRNRTQRSATITDMSAAAAEAISIAKTPHTSYQKSKTNGRHRKSSSAERPSRSSSLPRCTDPCCSFMPVCTDPNCYAYDCINNSSRWTDTNRCTAECYEYRCNSLPRCMDSKCLCKPYYQSEVNLIKHNSLPRCATTTSHDKSHPAHHRPSIAATSTPSLLIRGDSRASLSRPTATVIHSKHNHHNHHTLPTTSASVGKLLTKSVSAVSLNSRRRRHKTVHFGENLLREVCQNRKLIEPLQRRQPTAVDDAKTSVASSLLSKSGVIPLDTNIQALYNFVDSVLSSWVDEDDGDGRSGAESEPERGSMEMRPIYQNELQRLQTVNRIVSEAAQLRGTLNLGNSRHRHRHWKGTAKLCNERFLLKVLEWDKIVCWNCVLN